MIRAIVEDFYDIQKFRISVEGQLRSLDQGTAEGGADFFRDKVYGGAKQIEKDVLKEIQSWLKGEEIYTEWLINVKGVGPILSAGLIAWIEDITKFATISKLWRYSGMAVAEDGRAERRVKGQKICWNPRMKNLCWKLGESFVKTKGNFRFLYEDIRKDYDSKWKTSDDCKSIGCAKQGAKKGDKRECMKGHRYAAAKRKTVKIFLALLFMKWYELSGEKPRHPRPFSIDVLGHSDMFKPEDFVDSQTEA